MASDPLRILICEEALKNRRGHWYEYNRAIVQHARRVGIDATLLAHCDIDPQLRAELQATPWFPVTSWDQVYYHPTPWRRYIGIIKHNLRVVSLMRKYFRGRRPFDVVLVPTVVVYHWLAWRWLAAWGSGRYFKKLVLTTRNNLGEYQADTGSYRLNSSARVVSATIRSFGGLVRSGRVQLATDSSRLGRRYNQATGLPFITYPHPVVADANCDLSVESNPNSLPVFSALGPPRFEKGSDLILEALKMTLRDCPDIAARFVIHWDQSVTSPDGRMYAPDDDLKRDRRVEFIDSTLTTEEYNRRLRQSSVLLVPYRRAQYNTRLSGVAIEAFQAGVPCICVADTWLSEAMSSIGAGIEISDETPVALSVAMRAMLSDLPRFRQKARAQATVARETHSPNSFLRVLLQPSWR